MGGSGNIPQCIRGGGLNYICLPDDPEFLGVPDGVQNERGYVHGAEYQALDSPPALGNIFEHNVPCAA